LRQGRKARRTAAAPARISQPGQTRLSGSYGDFAGFWIGSCNGLVGGPWVTPPPCLRLLEPVALAVQLQNMDMMREAIEKRASETLATEDNGPFLEWQNRRDDGRATFVTLAEYFKQKLRASLRERHIAEFVNDEQFDGGELRLEFQETPLVANATATPREARSIRGDARGSRANRRKPDIADRSRQPGDGRPYEGWRRVTAGSPLFSPSGK
jgi:hypothetical protein